MKATNHSARILAIATVGVVITSAGSAFAASELVAAGAIRPTYQALETRPTGAAPASALDYRLELIGRPWQNGGIGKFHQADSVSFVYLRLVRSSDGAPLTDAHVTLSRVELAQDGMSKRTALSYIHPYDGPGVYRVEIHPTMSGRWAVTIAARMAGESEPVERTLTITLVK